MWVNQDLMLVALTGSNECIFKGLENEHFKASHPNVKRNRQTLKPLSETI